MTFTFWEEAIGNIILYPAHSRLDDDQHVQFWKRPDLTTVSLYGLAPFTNALNASTLTFQPPIRIMEANMDGQTYHTSRNVCVCVIGVGYVGESLLRQFGKRFKTIGYDLSEERVAALRVKYQDHCNVQITNNPSCLAGGTHFLIAVPTPLRKDHSVNLSHVISAISMAVTVARENSCIVIESSVPVGTTRELLGPYQSLFDCGMSPERIDPGRALPTPEEIPKLVSGLTPGAIKQITHLYAAVYSTLVPVSKPEVAEMAKLHENCYRMVNIAYVNEISDACLSHGIDPKEMIEAATTKPFGFQPFHPGLGVGGHCLPVNPHYLFHNNKKLPVLELATRLMSKRPQSQASRFHRKCQKVTRVGSIGPNFTPRILIAGIGFKPGQSNLAYSPGLEFAKSLADIGCERLAYYDPTVAAHEIPWMERLSDLYWSSNYVDNKFDGIAWCNVTSGMDVALFDTLKRVLFKRFVW